MGETQTSLGEFEQLVLLALVRLADDGYGVSIHAEIARRKKHFRIQPAGRRALKQSLASIRSMTEGVSGEPILDPEP